MDNLLESVLSIHKNLMDRVDIEANKLNLTQTEYLILLDILTHPGTDLNNICTRLSLNKSCASKAIKSLDNLVIRNTNEEDKRYITLSINPSEVDEGLCKKQALTNIFSEDLYHDTLKGLEEPLSKLNKILKND